MVHVLVAALCLFGFGTVALLRTRDEVRDRGRVGRLTFGFMLLGFFGAGLTAIAAASAKVWPLPIPVILARMIGVILAVAGISVCIAARWHFTFRRAWGLDFDVLVTGGIYQWSRNPQVLGWFLMYAGLGLFGRSAAALVIAVLFLIAFVPWIVGEERALEKRFGQEYALYREKTPRFL